jgi:uncharacterized membrane protein HdeD (DUF308 family)
VVVKPSSVVYWSRFLIAIATGVASVFALKGMVGPEIITSAYTVVAIGVYAVTAVVYRYVLHYNEAQLKGKNRYLTLGIGTFIFAWLMALTMTYTLLGLY